MVEDVTIATLTALSVTASFPFFLYGAWIMIDAETVTWDVLTYHLKFIAVGLTLTTVPMVTWMIPRLFDQLGGLSALHAFLGLQAYALLLAGLTGIVRIFQAKRNADLYKNSGSGRRPQRSPREHECVARTAPDRRLRLHAVLDRRVAGRDLSVRPSILFISRAVGVVIAEANDADGSVVGDYL
jgi:hypothetical protein